MICNNITGLLGSTDFIKKLGVNNDFDVWFKYYDVGEYVPWKLYFKQLNLNPRFNLFFKTHFYHDIKWKWFICGRLGLVDSKNFISLKHINQPEKILSIWSEFPNGTLIDEMTPYKNYFFNSDSSYWEEYNTCNYQFHRINTRRELININLQLLKGGLDNNFWRISLNKSINIALQYCGITTNINQSKELIKDYLDGGKTYQYIKSICTPRSIL